MTSPNLSRQCFNAANSRMNGMYFSSAGDVRLDENPMGWTTVFSVPLGRTVVNFYVTMPANPYLQPSVVTTNGVPSYFGPLSTGSLVRATFSLRNARSWSLVHSPCNENPFMALVYAAFPFSFGRSRFRAKSDRGWATGNGSIRLVLGTNLSSVSLWVFSSPRLLPTS